MGDMLTIPVGRAVLARPSERPANGQDELREYHDERVSACRTRRSWELKKPQTGKILPIPRYDVGKYKGTKYIEEYIFLFLFLSIYLSIYTDRYTFSHAFINA